MRASSGSRPSLLSFTLAFLLGADAYQTVPSAFAVSVLIEGGGARTKNGDNRNNSFAMIGLTEG
ncbi:MAG: hypothetical protein CL489_10125 [Acidobacteria bacterium]|nr:hypothetical protein [Acidobacteriota bacterium]